MLIQDCDDRLLVAYLESELPPVDENSIIEHVSKCERCQFEIRKRAAPERSWNEATQFLKDAKFDSIILSGLFDLEDFRDAEGQVAGSEQIKSVLAILNPSEDPNMLGRLGPYEVSGVVGSGGMGVVLKGLDPALNRTVAIKVLAPHLASSGAARKRFAREAKAAAAVLHPNVMSIFSVSNKAALPYLVMPYMRGRSLQARLDEQGPLELIEIVRVGAQIAAGLAAAHAQGLVHRDIKPANMMLADGLEQVAITDFGLARAIDDATMTRSGVIAGTPQYMSPEQARGESIDARSDLFSLGSLLYAMGTGHSPFRAETSFGVLRRITDEAPRHIRDLNPLIPGWLCLLIDLLLQKDRDARIQSAREVEQLLHECLIHLENPTKNRIPVRLLQTRWSSLATIRPRAWLGGIGVFLIAFASWSMLDKEFSGDAGSADVDPVAEAGTTTPSETKPIEFGKAVWGEDSELLLQQITAEIDAIEKDISKPFSDSR